MIKYRLFDIDFESAMSMEEGMYILQSLKEPTEQECLDALYKHNYTGTIYFISSTEIKEIDMRKYNGHVTLMNMD